MSVLFYFFKSYIIGFTIAAIFGPISMLFIRKTIELGLIGAVAVGLGSSIATGTYGLISVTGIGVISDCLIEKAIYIKLLGGAFLIYLAYKEIKPKTDRAHVLNHKRKAFGKLLTQVFLLSMANPLTIILFISLFASFTVESSSCIASSAMVLAIFLGSITWWTILGTILLKIKHKLSDKWINCIRYISAIILAIFGLYSIVSGFWKLI
jgi:putative LysE/RhtB family amino acid efflux pump